MSSIGICTGCRADTFGGNDQCFMCQSFDFSAEVVELKVQLARAVQHGTDEEAQKWAALAERDALTMQMGELLLKSVARRDFNEVAAERNALRAELAQIQLAMQPLIDGTAPIPSLVAAVEAMSLGSKMIWDAQKRRLLAMREALITLAPSVAVLSRDDRLHSDTRAELLRGETQMLAALLDTTDKS